MTGRRPAASSKNLLAGHPDYVPTDWWEPRPPRHSTRGNRREAERDPASQPLVLAPSDRDAQGALFHCLKEEGRDDEAAQVRAKLGQLEADWLRVNALKEERRLAPSTT